jgi:O-glycosyl hydrolase
MTRRFFVATTIGVFLGGCGPQEPSATTLTIETTARQTIKGWGIYPCTIRNDRPNATDYTLWNRPNAARLIWKELGISFWRCEILPGSYDAGKDDGSLDIRTLDESLVRQIRLGDSFGHKPYILSIWSPPAPFKAPAITFGTDPKTKKPAHLRPDREDAYCHYIVRVLDHLTKARKLRPPMAFSVQNEPNYASDLWNGTPYEPAQWQRVTKKMRRALNQGGYSNIQLIGPEGGGYADSVAFMGGPDADALKSDPSFAKALGGFAFHGYSALSRRSPHPEQLRGVAEIAAAKGKDIWMSEYSIIAQGQTPLDHALKTMQRLGRETAYVPCNYWAWWQGYYPKHPKGEVLLTGKDDNALHISKTYRVLQKLWHSAPAGSVVHRVQSSDDEIQGYAPESVQTVAFERNRKTTLLVINPTSKVKSLDLRGLQGKRAVPYLTNEKLDMKPQNSVAIEDGALKMELGARSILVIATQ